MDEPRDVRWIQPLNNYQKALAILHVAVQRVKQTYYSKGKFDEEKFKQGDDIVVEGIIQRFKYTHELAWNVMKDFLTSRGVAGIYGSRDATREAFAKALILQGDTWMDMIQSRNKSSHTYNEETAMSIFFKIIEEYLPCFIEFEANMLGLKAN